MKQSRGWKNLAAGLAALVLVFGTGLLCARAEEWPEETVNGAEGRIYKQVQTRDGGVEVWQFIGIFGSPDEALELVGLSEDGGKKGQETIGETPYKFSLKKTDKVEAEKPETVSKPEIGTLEGDSRQKPGNTGWRRPKSIGRTIPVDFINWGFNQIFIQENRASGR